MKHALATVASLCALTVQVPAQDAAIHVRQLTPVGTSPSSPANLLVGWEILDVSDDGSTVVGRLRSKVAPNLAFIESGFVWRPDAGTFDVYYESDALGLPEATNATGSRLASHALTDVAPAGMKVFVRDRVSGQPVLAQPLSDVGNASFEVLATNASGSGALVDRYFFYDDFWFHYKVLSVDGSGIATLGYQKPGWATPYTGFKAWDASSDLSSVLVQVIDGQPDDDHAQDFSWDWGVLKGPTEFVTLKNVPKGLPHAVSDDGNTVVGWVQNEKGFHPRQPVLWYKDKSAIKLALPPNAFGGLAYDVDGTGEVAVGSYQHKKLNVSRPFVWIKPRGTRDLGVMLQHKFGVEPPANVTLRSAWKVSADGTAIVGFAAGFGPNAGKVYMYRATLPQSEICYCNCDGSTGADYLNAADLACFQQRLNQKQFYTNCDNSMDANGKPTYDAADFQAFLDRFQVGCPE